MLIIFDYIYFRVTDYYNKVSKDDSDFVMGPVVISILQMLNIITVSLVIAVFHEKFRNFFDSLEKTRLILFILSTIILLLNYLRYFKFAKFQKLSMKFKDYSKGSLRNSMNKTVIAYIVLSLVLLIYVSYIFNKVG